ncbi:glycosyltransferase [Lactiplantibacillus plantarum]|uniref:glycosyltransferase n=1 Tax=Lactiplantibacillus plantarum TaxID=1590 RepID=UPI0032E370CA
MKILFISDNRIFGFGGGSVENKKYFDALKVKSERDGDVLKILSPDNDPKWGLGIDIHKSILTDITARILGHSSFLYLIVRKHRNEILDFNPDVVVLGRSRFGFVPKLLKKYLPFCKFVTNVDNVEIDFVKDTYIHSGILSSVRQFLESHAVLHDERDSVKYSDALIYLTRRNVERIRIIYDHYEDNPTILPICVPKNSDLPNVKTKKSTFVFLGSLDYEPNIEAVQYLINEIWVPNFSLRQDVTLVIAGRNPAKSLEDEISKITNIRIVANFQHVSDFAPLGAVLLAPIFSGSGMKVKVADALSQGFLVVGSEEALVGYEEAISDDSDSGIVQAVNSSEFVEAIQNAAVMDKDEKKAIALNNVKICSNYYDYSRSRKVISSVIDTITA